MSIFLNGEEQNFSIWRGEIGKSFTNIHVPWVRTRKLRDFFVGSEEIRAKKAEIIDNEKRSHGNKKFVLVIPTIRCTR